MAIRKLLRKIALYAGLGLAVLFAISYVAYRRDIRIARTRVATGSQIVDTPCGRIEYATAGEGTPILAVHGAGGGYDQGLDIAGPLISGGFRVIAMSRFGYLRTPFPADASPAAQADAHACLLDALHVPEVAVLGASAGAPSSMQFALRHPDRTTALVLMVPLTYPVRTEERFQGTTPKQSFGFTKRIVDAALGSDYLFWLAPRIAHDAVARGILGTPPEVVSNASAEDRSHFEEVLNHILPISTRRLGLLNEAAVGSSLGRYDLEHITAPTLLISAQDDAYGTWEGARYSADHIPGARFLGFPSGGHMLVGHQQEVTSEITRFLADAGNKN
jgi:pimeloyl-ACP methyl ester carboxylesterase